MWQELASDKKTCEYKHFTIEGVREIKRLCDFLKMSRQPGFKYLQAIVTVYSCLHFCLKGTSNNC